MSEEGGDPPRFGILHRGKAEHFLNAWSGPDAPAPDGWQVYLHTNDVDGLARDLAARGAEILAGPADRVYGLR